MQADDRIKGHHLRTPYVWPLAEEELACSIAWGDMTISDIKNSSMMGIGMFKSFPAQTHTIYTYDDLRFPWCSFML